MGFQFAEIATEIEAARLLTYNAARLKVCAV
jgi:alkylation response protein AidB-like acyl-CoA dehydrogenase